MKSTQKNWIRNNRPSDRPTPKELAAEIKKKYPSEEFVEIALSLLTHEVLDEPPALIKMFGQAMYEKGRLEGEGISGYNYTVDQAWEMIRREHFRKVTTDEE